MSLKEIIKDLEVVKSKNLNEELMITGVHYDSRSVTPGSIFVAIEGIEADGHNYLRQAYEKGAKGAVCQKDVGIDIENLIIVPDTREALSLLARRFYNYPDKEMVMIGITGTNGKTTTAHIIYAILQEARIKPALVGTLGYKVNDRYYELKHTTPQSVDVFRLLREIRDQEVQVTAMEVTSHGLCQKRVANIEFDIAGFTNLSQDHLDYHGTMKEYFKAKCILFNELLSKDSISIINIDDSWGSKLAESNPPNLHTYSINNHADFMATNIAYSTKGTSYRLITPAGEVTINSTLKGWVNVYNSLLAAGITSFANCSLDNIKAGLERPHRIKGRFDEVEGKQDFNVIIDFAHTPSALKYLLTSVRMFTRGKIILIFGCGGNRDRKKRPLMGQIAQKYADFVIITTDNPRNEEPEDIITDIIQGINARDNRTQKIVNREEAIKFGLTMALEGDVVIVAGKGHENYQEIKGTFLPFDDRKIIESWLDSKGLL